MRIAVVLALVVAVVSSSAVPESTSVKHGNLDWWENAIFYQIYPRSFKDSNGDGVGDIRGIIEKLDYLKELGIAGAWLSPIFKSPMDDFGYDISDFKSVDPSFGTNEDLEELFRKAKEKGLRIILDYVPNHTSDQHEWFQKSVKRIHPYTDYFVWHDGKVVNGKRVPPNNWVSIFYGSSWEWNAERGQYYYHNFVVSQPDLNYRNPLVVQEMKDVLTFWLDRGVAGFRIDAIDYLFEAKDLRDEPRSGKTDDPYHYNFTYHHFTKDMPETYDMVYQWRVVLDDWHKKNGGDAPIMMTEAYANNSAVVKYFNSDDGKREGSHMPFNFALITQLDETSTAWDFKDVIDNALAAVPKGKSFNWVLGNHDQPRVGSRYGIHKVDGLLTLVMTLPGVAVTYNVSVN